VLQALFFLRLCSFHFDRLVLEPSPFLAIFDTDQLVLRKHRVYQFNFTMTEPKATDNLPQGATNDTDRIQKTAGHHWPSQPKETYVTESNTTLCEPSHNEWLVSNGPVAMPWFKIPGLWLWEMSSCMCALLVIAAVVGVISHYDGQALADWPLGINLNTLISFLADILRAALLLIVAEIISQGKWDWFANRPRRLTDLQKFEDASRSVLGSFRLLFVAPSNSQALLAALVTILSLGIGPFVQQAAQTVACTQNVLGPNASLPIANHVPGRVGYFRTGPGLYSIMPELHGVLVNGLVTPNGNDSAIPPNCPTGNCTFPDTLGITHASIAMCSSCIDTSRFMNNTGVYYGNPWSNMTLPNGLSIYPVPDSVYLDIQGRDNLSWASSSFTRDFASVATFALLNVTMLSYTTAPCADPSSGNATCRVNTSGSGNSSSQYAIATSCALYPCMQNFHAKVTGGILEEQVISRVPAPVDRLAGNAPLGLPESQLTSYIYANYTALQMPCMLDGNMYDRSNFSRINKLYGRHQRTFQLINIDGINYTAPAECLYKMDRQYGMGLTSALAELFSGTCFMNTKQAGNLACTQYDPTTYIRRGSAWWLPPLYANGTATFASMNASMSNFTTAITNHFRKTGGSNYALFEQQAVLGVVQQSTVCTRFEWQWLLLPIFLIVVTVALLAWIMVKVYLQPEMPVWKSSLLPLLFHGFRNQGAGERQMVHMDELEKRAGRVMAVMDMGDGVGFVEKTALAENERHAG
jgi:hypothetical protein